MGTPPFPSCSQCSGPLMCAAMPILLPRVTMSQEAFSPCYLTPPSELRCEKHAKGVEVGTLRGVNCAQNLRGGINIMAKLRHIAYRADDVEAMANFFVNSFDMTIAQRR